MSLPAWECGLKLRPDEPNARYAESLPAWECGLKHSICAIFLKSSTVTPRVGVWIETLPSVSTILVFNPSHSPRGSVD